ncbi:PAS domain S-box protein [Ideonella margarita]|uniref:histidine kinase n=1 Tax=Ideonella margarita TaxID=2984191 RepID=A0ABU9C179_9BURK
MNTRSRQPTPDSLAHRLAAGAQRLVTTGALLIGSLSLVMIVWLLLQRSDAQLSRVSSELQAQMSSELSGQLNGLHELSGRTLVRNALVDPTGRTAYIMPTLAEHRRAHPGLRALWLTDHMGQALADNHIVDDDQMQDQTALALGRRCVDESKYQVELVRRGERWRLLVAYPVIFGSTGTVEGALVGELDLSALLAPGLGKLPEGYRGVVQSGDAQLAASDTASRRELSLAAPLQLTGPGVEGFPVITLAVHESALRAMAPAFWIGGAYLVLGALLLRFVRRGMATLSSEAVQPLQALRDAAATVTRDGLEAVPQLLQADFQGGGIEVQSLAQSFSAMLQRLLSAQTSLEQQVTARTNELAQAKQRLDSTLASLSDGVYALSIDRDQLLFASPPVARLLGLDADRVPMVRATMARLLSTVGLAELEQAFEAAWVNGTAVASFSLPGDAQGPRWIENRMTVVRDAADQPIRIDGILSDITSTVRARQAREQAVAGMKLRDRALVATGNGVLIMALQPGGAKAVYANPALAHITGAPIDELLRSDAITLQNQVVGGDMSEAMRECVLGLRDVRMTTRVRRKDGELMWCEVTISPMMDAPEDTLPGARRWVHHVVLVIDDVTERRRQKELHRRVIESINEVIFQTDALGVWTYLNPAWERITGRPASQMLGTAFLDALWPADRARGQALVEPLLRGEKDEVRQQLRYLTADGGVCWMQVQVQRLRDDDGQPVGFSGTLTDITEQRETEADLRLRNRAVDASSNGIVLTDIRKPGAPMVFINEGFTRLTGYSPEEALGRSCGFLQGGNTQQPGINDIRQAIALGEPCRVVLTNYRKDGARFDNDISIAPVHDETTGEITHYIGVLSDVTARLKAEVLLRDQFARLDTIFALSPDGFVSFDGEGRVVSANPAFERLTGIATSEVMGLASDEFDAQLLNVIEQRDPPGMAHWLSDVEDAGGAVHAEVLVLRGLPQKVVVCSRRDCDAPNVRQVLHLRDISRETEVDRMKSEFLSTAAHELRTPMASIRGFSDLLLMRKFDEARTRDVLQTINRQSIWLTDMINELLDLARIEARKGKDFHLEVTEVREVIDAGVNALMVPGDTREIDLVLPPQIPPVRVDRAKFQHALTNVLSNAYKYSPEGGRITLTVMRREHEGQDQVGVSVRDRGIGMSPSHARRAFERFFRADTSGAIPGTGLGLALVKEIIELHGGQVQLDSVLGEGTTVTLWLPVCQAEQALEPARATSG